MKGFTVPKLGVPGRPAGGIDVLATIPGYQVDLSRERVLQCLKECNYAHFLADTDFVPLDARMFRIRQRVGEQENPILVTASLVSKKIAASVTHVRLDVRVGTHGNFGCNLTDARANAMMFNGVARKVGLDSGCYLSDAGSVYQPFIGRGEALVALHQVFNDKASPWLREHIQSCWDMTETLVTGHHMPNGSVIREVFASNLKAQGSSIDAFDQRVEEIAESAKATIRARSTGYLQIDIAMMRQFLVQTQNAFRSDRKPYPDPCGIELVCRPDQKVIVGQPVAHVRGFDHLSRALGSNTSAVEEVFSVVPLDASDARKLTRFDSEWVMRGIE